MYVNKNKTKHNDGKIVIQKKLKQNYKKKQENIFFLFLTPIGVKIIHVKLIIFSLIRSVLQI